MLLKRKTHLPPLETDMNFKNCYKRAKLQLGLLYAFNVAIVFSLGCSGHKSNVNEIMAVSKYLDEEDKLFTTYMTGDVAQARQSLKDRIQHTKDQSQSVLSAHAQSGRLSMEYARLYVLEKRTGNNADAEEALSKSLYWRIRNLEPPYSTNDEDIIYVMSYPPEKVMKGVDKFDAGDNGDKPKYLQYITNSPIATTELTSTNQPLHVGTVSNQW